jgi:hypothetical protein
MTVTNGSILSVPEAVVGFAQAPLVPVVRIPPSPKRGGGERRPGSGRYDALRFSILSGKFQRQVWASL